MVHETILQEIKRQRLPQQYLATVEQFIVPLAATIASLQRHHGCALVVGVQGAQGSGKSTLATFLSIILGERFGLTCANLSLDDYYLTRSERSQLSRTVHPLLKTRGVPGTHDVQLAIDTIEQLISLSEAQCLELPRFNKAIDDRKPQSEWDYIQGKVDVILFEGWCIAAPPQPEASLTHPINALERQEDEAGKWRYWVNEQLKNRYGALFNKINYLIVLQAPSFEVVFDWRLLQEQKLQASTTSHGVNATGIMDANGVTRFIQHYERITRHCLIALPEKADCIFKLNRDHQIESVVGKLADIKK